MMGKLAFWTGIVILFFGNLTCAGATEYGSSLPMIGDIALAYQYDAMGKSALARGDFEVAKADYQSACSVCFDDNVALLGLARCDEKQGNFQEAVARYRPLVQINSYDIGLLTEFVLTLQEDGQISEAISYYNHALDLSKNGRVRIFRQEISGASAN